MTAPTPIDRQILAALEADTSRELVPELIQVFIKSAETRLSQITAYLAAGDLAGIAAESHALKSSSATFGADEVRRLCAELEAAGKNGDAVAAERLVAGLTRALDAAESDLAAYVKEISG
ncbi:MAG: Hpt domain-containing protein [Rhodospirillales bacterium]|tara:strand:+ start:326 stop:685 length:360 start_codon:yes stop_codon:yes gene_type:complete